MARLLLFNPEHDYALAHGKKYYTVPASIKKLASRLELLPLIWSKKGDFILKADGKVLEVFPGNVRIRSVSETEGKIESVEPWGWNAALKQRLQILGMSDRIMPSDQELDQLRRLSHRRISIAANEYLGASAIPQEFLTEEDALNFYDTNRGCYFKLPWSSGGRGVVATRELNRDQVKEWVSGSIRRQGSVLGEKGVDCVLNFASLWETESGKTHWKGWSVSLSDGRGKYNGNLYGAQKELLSYIGRYASTERIDTIAGRQKLFIEKEIAPYYSGKLGIDMMADRSGEIYPCVEVNLRRTMGHVAMEFYELPEELKTLFNVDSLPLKPLNLL